MTPITQSIVTNRHTGEKPLLGKACRLPEGCSPVTAVTMRDGVYISTVYTRTRACVRMCIQERLKCEERHASSRSSSPSPLTEGTAAMDSPSQVAAPSLSPEDFPEGRWMSRPLACAAKRSPGPRPGLEHRLRRVRVPHQSRDVAGGSISRKNLKSPPAAKFGAARPWITPARQLP